MNRQPKTVCEICGKKFENGNQLRAHKSSHSKKEFICDICGEKIIGASQYKIHKVNHTNKECLIIWEDEVNENNKEKLIIKINNFINSLKS